MPKNSFSFCALGVYINIFSNDIIYIKASEKRKIMQNEILTAAPLFDDKGRLAQRGYSKKMLLEYDRAAIKANKLRIKEWDYYLIMNDDFAVTMTVADNSYMGLVGSSLLDFNAPSQINTSVMTFMPKGKTNMPASTKTGDVYFKNSRAEYSFELDNGKRHLTCTLKNFKDKKDLKCDITLLSEPEESMTIATPYKEDELAFYYNQKINCMPASGTVEFDGKTYEFKPENSFGLLDWGRGVWLYNGTWYWSSASGIVNGKKLGFNLGYGFGDTSAATENMIIYEGKAHKLADVTFNIPMKDDKEDYMKPWTFSSSDGRFECDFVPVLDRVDHTDLFVIRNIANQVFGKFSGTLILDGGKKIEIKDFMGFAEKVVNRW